MNVLLVMDNDNVRSLRVMVTVKEKKLIREVAALLEENKAREAFDLLKLKAEVREYLPRGKRPELKPQVTLFEDML